MPTVPNQSKCVILGCKNPQSKYNNYCAEHGGRETFPSKRYNVSTGRKEALELYKSKQWQSMRKAQLSVHPLCAGCLSGGIVTQATQVDHLFPWQQVGEHSFFRNIFQSLCTECHSSKTGMEKQGICRRYGRPSVVYRVEDYERVMRESFDDPESFEN